MLAAALTLWDIALSEGEIDDRVAFTASLTTPEYAEPGRIELVRQAGLARISRAQRDTQRAFGPKAVQAKPPPLCRGGARAVRA
jgi:hypothetical protein